MPDKFRWKKVLQIVIVLVFCAFPVLVGRWAASEWTDVVIIMSVIMAVIAIWGIYTILKGE